MPFILGYTILAHKKKLKPEYLELPGPEIGKLRTQAGGTLKGLVLDLRNIPGGLLDAAVEVCDLFFENGELVAFTQGRTPDSRVEWAHRSTTPPAAVRRRRPAR